MSRRFQFGLGTMLAATAVVAVVIWLTYLAPNRIGVPLLAMLTMALGAFFSIIAIYGKASMRPFCIGALFPIGTSLVHGMREWPLNLKTFRETIDAPSPLEVGEAPSFLGDTLDSYQGELGLYILTAFAVGLLCSGLHWWLTRKESPASDRER